MFYIGWSINDILQNQDGRQLLTEAFHLYGLMLWLLEERIPGPVRERIVIAYLRCEGEAKLSNFKQVVKLVRATDRSAVKYRESYFARIRLPKDVLEMIISRLQQEDLYLQNRAFPSPSHKSTALANQASMLFLLLFFCPEVLRSKTRMREIVDRNFSDNWVLGLYMGFIADLTVHWRAYPAAMAALGNTLEAAHIQDIGESYFASYLKSIKELDHLLKEGVLQPQFVLENINDIMDTLRNANTTLRWFLLQRRTGARELRMVMCKSGGQFLQDTCMRLRMENGTKMDSKSSPSLLELYNAGGELVMDLLLKTSRLEFRLKAIVQSLLEERESNWRACKEEAKEILLEIAAAFTGKLTKRVKADGGNRENVDRTLIRILVCISSNVVSRPRNSCLPFADRSLYVLSASIYFPPPACFSNVAPDLFNVFWTVSLLPTCPKQHLSCLSFYVPSSSYGW